MNIMINGPDLKKVWLWSGSFILAKREKVDSPCRSISPYQNLAQPYCLRVVSKIFIWPPWSIFSIIGHSFLPDENVYIEIVKDIVRYIEAKYGYNPSSGLGGEDFQSWKYKISGKKSISVTITHSSVKGSFWKFQHGSIQPSLTILLPAKF